MKKPKQKQNKEVSKKEEKTDSIARLGQMYSPSWQEEMEKVSSIFTTTDPIATIRQTARFTTGGAY